MASITIRKLDDDLKMRLRLRAAEHGRSMEVEAREILREQLSPAAAASETGLDLFNRIHARFTPFGDVELQIPPRGYGRKQPNIDRLESERDDDDDNRR